MKALCYHFIVAAIIWQTFLWDCLATEEHKNNIFNHTARRSGPFQIGKDVIITISSDLDTSEIQPDTIINEKRVSHTYTVHNEEASYISLHFASLDIEGECRLLITDQDGKQAYTLKGKDKHGLTSFWSRLINGDTAILSVTCHGKNGVGSFLIDKYAAGFKHQASNNRRNENDLNRPNLRGVDSILPWEQRRELTICGADDIRNSQCFKDSHPTEYKMSRSVAKVVISGKGVCTGWLTTNRNYLVTNHHCISDSTEALNSYVIFNYEVQNGGGDCTRSRRESVPNDIQDVYDVEQLMRTSWLHDYSLIRLTDRASAPLKRYGFLLTEPRVPTVGEEIYIPHHPQGDDKAMSIWDSRYGANQRCRTLVPVVACYGSSAYLDVRYTCDTEGGSSGSPVISADTHKVLALHHCAEASTCSGNEGVPMSYLHSIITSTLGDWSLPHLLTDDCLEDQLEVLLELQTDMFGYETTWELRNSTNVLFGEWYWGGGEYFLRTNDFYTFKYCLARDDIYTLTIEDSGNDGMCCQHGNGSYTVYADGIEIATGGSFQSGVTINIASTATTQSVVPSGRPSGSEVSSISPSIVPSKAPSLSPSKKPSSQPSIGPSRHPSIMPSDLPSLSKIPSVEPSSGPSLNPSNEPSVSTMPSAEPSTGPSRTPSILPSQGPSVQESQGPSVEASQMPSRSIEPSLKPSVGPSTAPSRIPSQDPTAEASNQPSLIVSTQPTESKQPSTGPSLQLSNNPSAMASDRPSANPSAGPSKLPSTLPSVGPSQNPSIQPSHHPSAMASGNPSVIPSALPSSEPSTIPSSGPSKNPSIQPSWSPSKVASDKPSARPSKLPSQLPTVSPMPSQVPSLVPSRSPSSRPSQNPSIRPTTDPTSGPTSNPTSGPTSRPTWGPTSGPTSAPTNRPPTFNFLTPSTQVGFDGPRYQYFTPLTSRIGFDGPRSGS